MPGTQTASPAEHKFWFSVADLVKERWSWSNQFEMNTGNPLSVIQNRLQVLRAEKEMTESALDALEKEKECIKDILPRLLYELEQTKNNLEQKNAEMKVLDNAVDEITNTYGSVLYSSLYFSED